MVSIVWCAGILVAATPGQGPEEVVRGLLDADREFAAAAVSLPAATGLEAMFHDDVEMRAGAGMLRGRAAVVAALRALPDFASSRARWEPVRGGVSADGAHGFTFGTMVLTRSDSSTLHLKYLAYWLRTARGWRVRLYRRAQRVEGPVAPLAPALPGAMVQVRTDSGWLRRLAVEVDSVERAFSDAARAIGLGPAFARFGSADAMNIGAPNQPGFVIGNDAIAAHVSAGDPPGGSKLSWAPDHVLVASSGDLAATVGTIVVPGDGRAPGATVPFFTVWRRAAPGAPWRYVAE